MTTLLPPGAKPVTRLWETACAVRTIDLAPIAFKQMPTVTRIPGPQCQKIPLNTVIEDPEALRKEFMTAVIDLSAYGLQGGIVTHSGINEELRKTFDTPAIPDLALSAEVWREGYEVPQDCADTEMVGWCFISATKPRHKDSGSISVLDPRAGSEGTAMPGLPWGREYMFRPAPGLMAVVPGWLTSTVRPVEDGQTVVVVVAHVAT